MAPLFDGCLAALISLPSERVRREVSQVSRALGAAVEEAEKRVSGVAGAVAGDVPIKVRPEWFVFLRQIVLFSRAQNVYLLAAHLRASLAACQLRDAFFGQLFRDARVSLTGRVTGLRDLYLKAIDIIASVMLPAAQTRLASACANANVNASQSSPSEQQQEDLRGIEHRYEPQTSDASDADCTDVRVSLAPFTLYVLGLGVIDRCALQDVLKDELGNVV